MGSWRTARRRALRRADGAADFYGKDNAGFFGTGTEGHVTTDGFHTGSDGLLMDGDFRTGAYGSSPAATSAQASRVMSPKAPFSAQGSRIMSPRAASTKGQTVCSWTTTSTQGYTALSPAQASRVTSPKATFLLTEGGFHTGSDGSFLDGDFYFRVYSLVSGSVLGAAIKGHVATGGFFGTGNEGYFAAGGLYTGSCGRFGYSYSGSHDLASVFGTGIEGYVTAGSSFGTGIEGHVTAGGLYAGSYGLLEDGYFFSGSDGLAFGGDFILERDGRVTSGSFHKGFVGQVTAEGHLATVGDADTGSTRRFAAGVSARVEDLTAAAGFHAGAYEQFTDGTGSFSLVSGVTGIHEVNKGSVRGVRQGFEQLDWFGGEAGGSRHGSQRDAFT